MEFRDLTLNGAVSKLYMELSGKHRARHDTIDIIRTSIVAPHKIRKDVSKKYKNTTLRFPLLKKSAKPS